MPNGPRTLRFADCVLNLDTRELVRDGQPQPVEPKAFDLLTYLLENRDRVVGKHELQDALWPGVIVTEAALARTVMKARKAIGAGTQAVIKTVSRHGYRFIADIEDSHAARVPEEPPGLSAVHFVPSGDVHIAWRTLGSGPIDILFCPGFVSHLDNRYRIAPLARFDAELARNARLIAFDKRGVGLSDRIGYPPTVEDTVADMLAVLDAAGSKQAILFGVSESGPATAMFAALHPARTQAVIMYAAFVKGVRSDDYDLAPTRTVYDAWLDDLLAQWGGPASLEYFAPTMAAVPEFQEGWARYLRSAATPGSIRHILEVLRDIDVRDVLPQISAPTLILHRKGDRLVRHAAGKDMAQRIPGARFVSLDGDDHWWFVGDSAAILREINAFIDEQRSR